MLSCLCHILFLSRKHASARVVAAFALGGLLSSGHAQHVAPPAAELSAFNLTEGMRAGQAVHVSVGHLLVLNAATRVRRLYIANPAVLDSNVFSSKQVVLTAKAPGFSSVVIWDEHDQQQTYLISSDINTDDLQHSIDQAIPGEHITVEGKENRVILTGTVATAAMVETAGKLAGLFAKDVLNSLVVNSAHVKQVRLNVRIVEVDRSRLNQLGINLFSPGGGNYVASGSTQQFPSTAILSTSSDGSGSQVGGNTLSVSSALNFLFYNSQINIGAAVQDLENKQVLQILAEPNITTLSGQRASFLAGGEFPFPVVQGSSAGLTSITIQFRPYGVKLDFTPEVNVDGTITLKVMPEVSALDYTNSVEISGYTIPALTTKHAETQVVLRSGQSFAISGLLDKRTTDSLARTPGIANVPILGALFRSKGVQLSTSELIVIVTPNLIDPLTEQAPPKEPAPVRPFLDQKNFDDSLPTSRNKQPAP